MKAIMQVEIPRSLFGRTVRDMFGRRLGVAVGLLYGFDGQLASIGVDLGGGDLVEYPGGRVVADGENFVIVPQWKIDSQAAVSQKDRVQKRSRALIEADSSWSVSESIQEEMQRRIDEIRESHHMLVRTIRSRIEELDLDDDGLQTFLGSVRLELESGEIDDTSFRVTSDFCNSCMQANKQERDELSSTLNVLTEVPPQIPEAEATTSVEQGPTGLATAPVEPGQEQAKPEPVSAQEGSEEISEVNMSLKTLRMRFR